MSVVVIPTDTTGLLFWDQSTTLDGVVYSLGFRYNSRESCYYLQIATPDGTVVYAQGLKLVCNFPLLQGYATPPGEIICLSQSTSNDGPPVLGEMGDGQRCTLLYFEQADTLAGGSESWRNPGGPFAVA